MCAALFLAFAFPAFADVVSKAPDSVVLTVYRDRALTADELRSLGDDTTGLALVTEARTVDLPAGRTRIAFQGVADEIIPASARLEGLPGALVERNFDYDLTTPGALIDRSVGSQVTLRRLNTKTGQLTEEPATLLSGPDGVMVRTQGGVEALGCGAGPEALVFDHLPEGLADKPTLSVVADIPAAGRYVLHLSYLMVQVDWSADYVARLAPDGKTLDLTGWLTLSNRSGASFEGAPTSVVAGQLARVDPDLPDITPTGRTPQCWPMGTTTSNLWRRREAMREEAVQRVPIAITAFTAAAPQCTGGGDCVAEMVVTAEKRVTTSALGDYKLYSLVEPTTLAARQIKQIRFLHQTGVKFETIYVFDIAAAAADGDDQDQPAATTATLSFENKDADGLGLPLPAGIVTVRQPQAIADGWELFVGEHKIRDVPVNEPFELAVGEASDVEVASHTISETSVGSGARKRDRTAEALTITNAKPMAVAVEVRIPSGRQGLKVVRESVRHVLKNGSDVWRLTVPANGEATLDLTVDSDS